MSDSERISISNGQLTVPNNPEINYIEGDGIGIDITPVMIDVVDSAVEKAYASERRIHWSEVLAGQKAFDATGEWLPLLIETVFRFHWRPPECDCPVPVYWPWVYWLPPLLLQQERKTSLTRQGRGGGSSMHREH